MSTPPASRGGGGGDDTADDGGTDSFWRDFVIYARVVHEGKARGRTREGSETTRGERGEREVTGEGKDYE